jgi:serine/threonine protein kinase
MKCSSCGTHYPDTKIFCLTCGELLISDDGQVRLGNYLLKEKIGQGGVGIVFRAVDESNQNDVAIKILNSQSLGDVKHMQRFRREIRVHAKLKHKNIIAFKDIFEEGDVVALVMELLSGCNLKEYINHKGALALPELLDIAIAILSALEAAHAQGVVHRDLKPSNVFMTDSGEVKLMDFGLAKSKSTLEDITDSGITVGTYMYMAPEQIMKKEVGVYTDLYAFGIVLYRMATALLPFMSTGGGEFEIMEKQVRQKPNNPQDFNPSIPSALAETILHLLEKEPADRPKSCLMVIRSLNRIRESLTPSLEKGEETTTFSELNTGISQVIQGMDLEPQRGGSESHTVDFHTLLSAFSLESKAAPDTPPFDMRHPKPLDRRTVNRLKVAISSIPPLPNIWHELQVVFADQHSSPADLAKILEQDRAVAKRVLRSCNTAAYLPKGSKEETSLTMALTRVGMDAAQGLVLSAVAPEFSFGKACKEVQTIWYHGQVIALFSKVLSDYSPALASQQAIMFGLLHDIGKLVIIHLENEETLAKLKQQIDEGKDSLLAEIDVLGYSHIDAGMMLALHWKLPRDIQRFIYYHHFPCWQKPETWPPDVQASVMLIHMSHLLLSSLSKGDELDGVWSGAHRTHVAASESLLHKPLKLPVSDASLYSNLRVQMKHLQRLFTELYT